MEEGSEKQLDNNRPWLFQKGKSGNPGGRPSGTVSLKTRAKRYLEGLSEEEAIEYFDGLNKLDVWKMAEGNPETKAEVKVSKDTAFTEEELEIAKQILEKRISNTTSNTSIGETIN